MVKTIEALFDGTVFHAAHRHIAVVTTGGSMRTLRRRIGYMGLLIVVLSVGLLWSAQPTGAAGAPPIIQLFRVSADNGPGFTTPQLDLVVHVDDPDGQVPLTIQSVIVTTPDSRTLDLTNRFAYPNLSFQGSYELFASTPVTGTYTVVVTDKDGNTATATHVLNAFPSLLRPPITFPQPEQILTTTTPTFQWNPVPNQQSVRVRIINADIFQRVGAYHLKNLGLKAHPLAGCHERGKLA